MGGLCLAWQQRADAAREHWSASALSVLPGELLELAPGLSAKNRIIGMSDSDGNLSTRTGRVHVFHRLQGIHQDTRLGNDPDCRLHTTDGRT
jgi:hypothetical protein